MIDLSDLRPEYVQWLDYLQKNRRYSEHTLSAYKQDLLKLQSFIKDQPMDRVTLMDVRQYMATLHEEGLSPRSIARLLASWRGFYDWLSTSQGLTFNPVHGLKAPKVAKLLPKALSVDQTAQLLDVRSDQTQTSHQVWLNARDAAMFELLYSSGLRLSELISVDVRYIQQDQYQSTAWVDWDNHDVLVTGKGGKQRVVPVGKQAMQALSHWLTYRQQTSNVHRDSTYALFLGARGRRISARVVQLQLAQWGVSAGVPTHVHPHVLRHSFASHVLQSSEDLRAVQELLGHSSISTTQVYTRLDFQHLAKVYDKAHPRAKRK